MSLVTQLADLETQLRQLGDQLETQLRHERAETARCRAARRDHAAATRRADAADANEQIEDALAR